MTVATIDYTDASQMLADYAARRARLYAPARPVVSVAVLPKPATRLVQNAYSLWTEQDKEMLRALAAEGLYADAIGRRLCRSASGVKKVAYQLGVKIDKPMFVPVRAEPKPEPKRLAAERDARELPDKQTARAIIDHICADLEINKATLLGECRQDFAVSARHQAIWMIARDTGLSYPSIGKIFGRDHTSVLHAVRRQNAIRGANVRRAGVA